MQALPARVDIYAKIHKALRAQMSAAIAAFARLDPLDGDEVAAALAQLEALLGACAKHLDVENTFVHPAMETRRPGSATQIADEHAHHLDDIVALRAEGKSLLAAAPACRAAAASSLHAALCEFTAANFVHMAYEEREHNAVLWATHTDAELIALEMAIVASLTPEQKAASMRWMLPAISHAERVGMLMGMKASAPPPAVAAALDLLRTSLSAKDWHKLERALEPQAA